MQTRFPSAPPALAHLLTLALLLSLALALQPEDGNLGGEGKTKKIRKKVLIKKANFPTKKSKGIHAAPHDHRHVNSVPDSYRVPNVTSGYPQAAMMPFGEEEGISMTMIDANMPNSVLNYNLTPTFDPYLGQEVPKSLLKKSKFPPKKSKGIRAEARDHHHVADSYHAPNVTSGYLPPAMTPFGEDEAVTMTMIDANTPNSILNYNMAPAYDPYLGQEVPKYQGPYLGGSTMSIMPELRKKPKTLGGLLGGSKITLEANIKMMTPIPFCQFENSPCKVACTLGILFPRSVCCCGLLLRSDLGAGMVNRVPIQLTKYPTKNPTEI